MSRNISFVTCKLEHLDRYDGLVISHCRGHGKLDRHTARPPKTKVSITSRSLSQVVRSQQCALQWSSPSQPTISFLIFILIESLSLRLRAAEYFDSETTLIDSRIGSGC